MPAPVRAQIAQVYVPPVVHVAHKDRGNHPQSGHPVQLIPPHGLAMNHHRAQIGLQQARVRGKPPLPAPQQLFAGRVSVAMGQQLQPVLGRRVYQRLGCRVVHPGQSAGVAAHVGAAQPGGAALGRAVQLDFVAAQLDAAGIGPGAAGVRTNQLPGVLVKARVDHHIHPQPSLRPSSVSQVARRNSRPGPW